MPKKKGVLGRLLKEVFKRYPVHILIVLVCIVGQYLYRSGYFIYTDPDR